MLDLAPGGILQSMEWLTEEAQRVKVSFSPIDVGDEVELVTEGDDHECAAVGMLGIVVAKHVSTVNGKYFIRLQCGHGQGCTCSATRDQIKLSDIGDRFWN